MFAQIKRMLKKVGKQQIKVIRLESNSVSMNTQSLPFYLIALIPRKAYFETHKSYPLSIGKDISKVATVDAKQLTPYQAKWSSHLVIKQQEQYLVYYFSLLPKYEYLLDSINALFVMPVTAHQLFLLAKKEQQIQPLGFNLDSSGVSISSVDADKYLNQEFKVLELIQFNLSKSFFNKDILSKLEQKLTRWHQVKAMFSLIVAAGLYFSISAGYLAFVEYELKSRQEQVRPVITELFKSKAKAESMLSKQQEMYQVLQQSNETLNVLNLIESISSDVNLEIDSIEVKGKLVTVKATSDSANNFFEKLLNSNLVSNPEFKSDIKKTGREQSREKFTLQFTWLGELWGIDE